MTTSNPTALLAEAIRRHDTVACKRLLAEGADPNGCEREDFDQMLSIAAVAKAPLALCVALMDAGADISPVSTELPGPLFRAAKEGYLALCKELIKRGANPNGLELAVPRSPLAYAASEGHVEVCQYLIDHGADVSLAGGGGWAALHHAAFGAKGDRRLDVCRVLVDAGASPSLASKPPAYLETPAVTPFQLTVISGNVAVAEYFIQECGESPSQTTEDGRSMLDLTDDNEILQILRLALTEESVAGSLGNNTATAPSRAAGPKLGAL